MSNSICETVVGIGAARESKAGMCVGRIIEVMRDGRALVDFPGNSRGPVESRQAAGDVSLDAIRDGVPVLLFFENGDPRLPIVVGVVRDKLAAPQATPARVPRNVTVDGRKIAIDAQEELSLRCGKCSITLRRDGKIVIEGMHLVSRAEGTNRIKGGSVAIN